MRNPTTDATGTALPRRDLMAIFAYVGRRSGPARCVDGSFEGPDCYLDRLAASARMQ